MLFFSQLKQDLYYSNVHSPLCLCPSVDRSTLIKLCQKVIFSYLTKCTRTQHILWIMFKTVMQTARNNDISFILGYQCLIWNSHPYGSSCIYSMSFNSNLPLTVLFCSLLSLSLKLSWNHFPLRSRNALSYLKILSVCGLDRHSSHYSRWG